MSDDRDDHKSLTPQSLGLPGEGRWAKLATEVTGPIGAFKFGIGARANMRAMRDAMQHAKVFGDLVDAAKQTIAKIHDAQEVARGYALREHLAAEITQAEAARIRDQIAEEAHQRAVAQKRRAKELLEVEQKVLDAKHSVEATKKFKPLKFELGRMRAEARRKEAEVDKATAEAAASELGEKSHGAKGTDPKAEWLDQHIAALRARIKEGNADGEDTAHLHVELQVLLRLRGET